LIVQGRRHSSAPSEASEASEDFSRQPKAGGLFYFVVVGADASSAPPSRSFRYYNGVMTPPEVVLDRWLKKQARERPGCQGYIGKLDIDKVMPTSFGSFLAFVQGAMNLALQSENANASGGAAHPPFHFDYVEVNDGTKNAHAFQHGGFSFIVATLPLLEMIWNVSQRLSRSPNVQRLLGIDAGAVRLEALQALFVPVPAGVSRLARIHTPCASALRQVS